MADAHDDDRAGGVDDEGDSGTALTRRTLVGLGTAGFLHAQTEAAQALSLKLDLKGLLGLGTHPHPTLREADGSAVRCHDAAQFQNWGRTVTNTPATTFVPRTKQGV